MREEHVRRGGLITVIPELLKGALQEQLFLPTVACQTRQVIPGSGRLQSMWGEFEILTLGLQRLRGWLILSTPSGRSTVIYSGGNAKERQDRQLELIVVALCF